MQAKSRRNIEQGKAYDRFFPAARLTDTTQKRGASVDDTVRFIPRAVAQTKWQTQKLAQALKGDTLYSTCHNIWDFVYHHIRYHKDEEGREQVRSPARSWHDRFRGVDCDCYTTFISTLLSNLKIPHVLRITKYGTDRFQHIYPIVPTSEGHYITLDCVVDRFDYEEPYTEKKDTPMDLEFLEGLEEEAPELGKLKIKLPKINLHSLNKLNPATVLLRNGVLASMKLNLFKVPQRLKYAYLSEEEAKSRGVDMDKWQQLVKVKDKLENIFYGAGGTPENMKKAILTGMGNAHHDVSGVTGMNENTPLPLLLGKEIYQSENSIAGLGDLGDPATAGAVTAASGIMGVIATILKTIGNIFPKSNTQGSSDFSTSAADDAKAAEAAKNASEADKKKVKDAADKPASQDESDSGDTSSDNGGKKSFWQKNKKWLMPALIGLGGLGALFGGYKWVMADDKERKKSSLSGLKHSRGEKKPVALL